MNSPEWRQYRMRTPILTFLFVAEQSIESSGAGELPPCALTDPHVNLSIHTAPIAQPHSYGPIANAQTTAVTACES